jgi:hypothetical protein
MVIDSQAGETGDQSNGWWNDMDTLKAEFDIYQAVRRKIQAWHPEIYRCISRAEMDYVGKKLKMLTENTFIFESEEHTAIFMDYLVNFSCPNGTTALERYLKSVEGSKADHLDELGRAALAGTRYAVLRPLEARPKFGVLCEDMLGGQRLFLMDGGLSQMPDDKLLFATAIYPVRSWIMTTGAALPFPCENTHDMLDDMFQAAGLQISRPLYQLKKADISRLALTNIRIFLMAGGLKHIEYR